tara:strand:+ start:187 stop:471 length:285 start_codon:yes stop_codon:yes gene_type:complete
MDLKFIKYIWQSNYILQVKTRVMTSINTMARQQQGWKVSLKEGISIFFTSLVELIAIAMSLIILSVILFLTLICGLGISLAGQVMKIINRGQKE